mgnify:CR=1 FL=1
MEYVVEKKGAPGRECCEVLGATFEPGKPDCNELGQWRQKLEAREDKLRYLQTAERYYYSKDWFGSERRKTPA